MRSQTARELRRTARAISPDAEEHLLYQRLKREYKRAPFHSKRRFDKEIFDPVRIAETMKREIEGTKPLSKEARAERQKKKLELAAKRLRQKGKREREITKRQ